MIQGSFILDQARSGDKVPSYHMTTPLHLSILECSMGRDDQRSVKISTKSTNFTLFAAASSVHVLHVHVHDGVKVEFASIVE